MRASRAISMLIALQQRGRLTAAQLATELEVSVRTVLRDVETLSAAGVPIFAVQGAGGGIEVLSSFRTELTGLSRDEGEAAFLAGQPGLAEALGLEVAATAARRKLLQALPPGAAEAASGLDRWFHHDPVGPEVPVELIRVLARAIRSRVEVRLGPAERQDVVRPLGLVLVAGSWLLVHRDVDGPATRELAGMASPAVLGRRFERPPDFDLTAFWVGGPLSTG